MTDYSTMTKLLFVLLIAASSASLFVAATPLNSNDGLPFRDPANPPLVTSKQKRQSEVVLTHQSRYTTINQEDRPQNDTGFFGSLDDILRSTDQGIYVMSRMEVKRESCVAKTFNQTLKFPGCESREISNRQCHGRCNSFYIPVQPNPRRRNKSVRGRRNNNGTWPGEVEYLTDQDLTRPQFKNCPVCRPNKTKWITLTLSCPDLNPKYRKIRIKKVKGCSCKDADAPN